MVKYQINMFFFLIFNVEHEVLIEYITFLIPVLYHKKIGRVQIERGTCCLGIHRLKVLYSSIRSVSQDGSVRKM